MTKFMTRVTTPVPSTAFTDDFLHIYRMIPSQPTVTMLHFFGGGTATKIHESKTIEGDRQQALALYSRHHELAHAYSVVPQTPMVCIKIENEALEQVASKKEQLLWQEIREQAVHFVLAWHRASANNEPTRPLTPEHYVPDLMAGRWLMQTKSRTTRMNSGASGTATVICWGHENWSNWFKKLDELQLKRSNWEGGKAGPPNDVSIRNANVFLECLQQAEYPPKQITPSVVGGVGVTFRNTKKKVYVEFTNKGIINALFSDGETRPSVENVRASSGHYSIFIEKIKAYLNEQDSAYPAPHEDQWKNRQSGLPGRGISLSTSSS